MVIKAQLGTSLKISGKDFSLLSVCARKFSQLKSVHFTMNIEVLFDRIYLPERKSRVAVLYEDRDITYEEMRTATVRTAETLRALGINAEDRVAILLNDSPEFIASFVAVISLGAIAVPINMALLKKEQRFILNDCGARAAIVEAGAVESIFSESTNETASLVGLTDLLVVSRDGDSSAPSSIAGIRAHLFANAQRQPLDQEFPAQMKEDSPAFILYTSGSTGEPKAAVHRQSDVFYTNETYCREVLQLRGDDRLFSSSRLPFAYGLGNAFTFHDSLSRKAIARGNQQHLQRLSSDDLLRRAGRLSHAARPSWQR